MEEEAPIGSTLLEFLEFDGDRLSRYCYDKRLGTSGNCRMCLVEVRGAAKPVLGCTELVRDGLEFFTASALVEKSKEGILEFLLKNHPLDCPICDEGGECDLQEGSLSLGVLRSRNYEETRREVRVKYIDELVSGEMQRCILCSRCVRYGLDILGNNNLGLMGRGEEVEVSVSSVKSGDLEIEGNVIDLCPVGLKVLNEELCLIL